METGLNIVIPMAGLGSRFTDYGFTKNKYLLPIDANLTPMIEAAILSLKAPPSNTCFIFIVREEAEQDNSLRQLLGHICEKASYNYKIISTNKLTEGPTSTVYLARQYIDNDIPLIVSNSDQILDWNFHDFIEHSSAYDGTVLTYKPDYPLIVGSKDKNSFVRCDGGGQPVQFTEKIVVSDEALVGVHYYRKGSYFVEAANYTFENNMRAPNGEFYLSLTYQAMLHLGRSLGTFNMNIKGGTYYAVGEPADYFNYYNRQGKAHLEIVPIDEIPQNKEFNFFKCSGTQIELRDELVIILSGTNAGRAFFSGAFYEMNFPAGTYLLRHPVPPGQQYRDVPIEEYMRGWLIGNFEPAIVKTRDYEIGILTHAAGEQWGFHYHQHCKEINILLSGHFLLNNIPISTGTVFIINKNVIACPKFLETCKILCIKIPSVPGDKTII